MSRFLRDMRLIPVVLIATACLFALKVSGLVFDGGYTLADRLGGRDKTDLKVTNGENLPAFPKITIADNTPAAVTASQDRKSWAQEMFGFNRERDVTGSVKAPGKVPGPVSKNDGDITYSSGGGHGEPAPPKDAGPPLKVSNTPPEAARLEVAGSAVPLDQGRIASPGERAVLERLQDRRQELESRNRELEMRESLIKAAEKRLEAKANDIKTSEAKVADGVQGKQQEQVERFRSLVVMYETMKPKEAARIFDRLDLKILVDVSTQMNPRKMAEVLAQMSPEAAERLTVELATRAGSQANGPSQDQLPKIDGKPAS